MLKNSCHIHEYFPMLLQPLFREEIVSVFQNYNFFSTLAVQMKHQPMVLQYAVSVRL